MIRIISGGQTGVDRAALDAAMALGVDCGGWCPKGRKSEDGRIPAKYHLRETPSEDYVERTRLNVQDSDGVLILTIGDLDGGTSVAHQDAIERDKPFVVVELSAPRKTALQATVGWLRSNRIGVVNVAGPRESHVPGGIYKDARVFLEGLLIILGARPDGT